MDVRYRIHSENQRCFRDKSRSVICTYLDYKWPATTDKGSGGLAPNNRMPTCPPGFSNFIDTCVHIPTDIPVGDFNTAASTEGCLKDGKTLFRASGFYIMEALKYYFKDMSLTSSFWIGRWTDVEKDLSSIQVEWAEDGKTTEGDCVIADVNNNFKWTRTDCLQRGAYLCKLWMPKCPKGYTFVPKAGSHSCFKITERVAFTDSSMMYPSISNANKMCLYDGTSLAAPKTQNERLALWDWLGHGFLEKHGKISAPDENFRVYLGIRSFKERLTIPSTCSSCQWDDHFYTPWDKYLPNPNVTVDIGINVGGSVDQSCSFIHRNSLSGAIQNMWCYKPMPLTNAVQRAICEYRECRINDEQSCIFPFRLGGRTYDKCTTVGSETKDPWCSLKVDENQNHIPGYEAPCPTDCSYSDCPVGFWPHLGTCLQDSASFPSDAQISVGQAKERCMEQGARLYQPRSTRSLRALAVRTKQFYDKTYEPGLPGSSGILGWKLHQETAIGITISFTDSSYNIAYDDGSVLPEKLIGGNDGLSWKTDFPMINETMSCINFIEKGFIKNSACGDYDVAEEPNLSYLCEARPFTTIDGADPFKACHFPFKVSKEANWSHSCVYDHNKVWCATEVDEAGVVKSGKTGICEDERNTAFDGPGRLSCYHKGC